ncbi:MAG: hypothetical protein M0026_18190 [Nocardiopsaceae bacterium]|nr:hypothetical protein [Nocardiopsaceae bacterium]
MGLAYLRPHVGADSARWTTLPGRRVVLAIARTFTSTVRLLEALSVCRGDQRIQVVFSFDDTSAFNAGTESLLLENGVCLLPWETAASIPADLIVTASENVDLSGFSAPVVLLPHGVGFQKFVPDSLGRGRRLSGVVRAEFVDAPNVRTVVSHPAQRDQLRSVHPSLADRAEVVGDPVHDRIRAGARLRADYRRRLGISDGHRLVTVTSTWGDQGLLGKRPLLPARLLAELPHDRYRVAAVLHPNIWFAHSPWQVRHWLADALDAGLLLIPPERGWEAALIASDCVIGDHGSVTLYGAAADRPVLLGAFGMESVPGTAIERLATTALLLDDAAPLLEQVEAAIGEYRPGRYAAVAQSAFSHVGEAGRRLALLFYGLLGIPAPEGSGRVRAAEPAEPGRAEVTAFEVHTRLSGTRTVSVERFPAAVRAPEPVPEGTVRHLSACESEQDDALVHSASVLYRAEPLPSANAARAWAEAALDRHPGCVLACTGVPGGGLVAVRGGRIIEVRAVGDSADRERPDPCLQAALVYAVLADRRDTSGDYTLRVGGRTWTCSLLPDR